MTMKEILEQIEQKMNDFRKDTRFRLDKGNKATGLHARRHHWIWNFG